MNYFEEQFRSLHLSGMAECWQTIEETRKKESLSLDDGLRMLIQYEKDWRQNKRTARLIKKARFRYNATVADIICDPARGRDKDRVMELATCGYIDRGLSVLVTGPAGVGKSLIVSAYGNQACLNGYKVAYYNMQKLLETLQLARIEGTAMRLYEKLADVDLLIIDDFGMRVLDGKQLLDFMELIEDRHGRKSTMLASKLPVKSWYEVFAKNATIADALVDRLVKTSYHFELKGDSLRKKV